MIHSCIVDALSFPQDKRAHRFFLLEADDFYYPAGRTPRYTIVRSACSRAARFETKRTLIRLLFERAQRELDLAPADLEVTITETPKHN